MYSVNIKRYVLDKEDNYSLRFVGRLAQVLNVVVEDDELAIYVIEDKRKKEKEMFFVALDGEWPLDHMDDWLYLESVVFAGRTLHIFFTALWDKCGKELS